MEITLVNLLKLYAEQNAIPINRAIQRYYNGNISKMELLHAYLEEEGIYGYTQAIWKIFEALGGKE